MITLDDFSGPNQRFAFKTAERVVTAINCENQGEPWPAWSTREALSVALVLLNIPILHEEGFMTLPEAAQYISDSMDHPFANDEEAKAFFAGIRACVEQERFTALWEHHRGERGTSPRAYQGRSGGS
jgi:hypothetical protein